MSTRVSDTPEIGSNGSARTAMRPIEAVAEPKSPFFLCSRHTWALRAAAAVLVGGMGAA